MSRRFLHDSVCAGDDRPLHHDEMGNDLGGRPSAIAWARFPLVGRDSVCRSQQPLLGASQLLEDGFESRHEALTESWLDRTAVRLQRGPACLLKCVRQLQHARFSKCRTEDLQTDWELAADLAAGHRDSRHTCQ